MSVIKVPVNWKPRPYQFRLWNYLQNGGKRGVAVWHRRAGKDLTALNWTATSLIQRPGLYWHLLPTYNQGRKIAWDGMTKTGRGFVSHFPQELICGVNNTDMKLEFKNGSIWQVVGTDNVDRLVGANPVGCVFSEYSLQDPRAWDYIRPILMENDGWALFIYTPRGRNHGFDLYDMARKNKDWYCECLSVDKTKAVTEKVIQAERDAGMPDEMINQEFYCSFDSALVGAYYGKEMKKMQDDKRITTVPHDPMLEVHTIWDLGIDDSMTIGFVQIHGREVRFINYIEDTGKGLPHYARLLKELADTQEYNYGRHLAPHDIKVRELGTGRSRFEVAAELGIRFTILPRLSVEDGISAVRNLLPMTWMDETKCYRLIQALLQYRQDWDEKKRLYTHVHDWTSHGADMVRMLAIGLKQLQQSRTFTQEIAINDYDPLGW